MRDRTLTLAAVVLSGLLPVAAGGAQWSWQPKFTESSDAGHIKLHQELLSDRLGGVLGIPVKNARWTAPGFELDMASGTVFVELGPDGSPMGAFFTGAGTVRFSVADRIARDRLKEWLSREALDMVPISNAYIVDLSGTSLADQIGAGAAPSVTLDGTDADLYLEAKAAMGQRGLDTLYEWLNRDGRCRGTRHALFGPEFIRATGSQTAYLLYSFDPDAERPVRLSMFGHADVVSDTSYRHFFFPLATSRAPGVDWQPQGRVEEYSTRLSVGQGTYSSVQASQIRFRPDQGTRALRLELTPRMKVTSVTGPSGPLPFLQWRYLANNPNMDETVLVPLSGPPEPGEIVNITVSSEGSLFEPIGDIHWLAEEDLWYPQLDDPEPSLFDLRFTVPKDKTAVASGDLLSDTREGDQRLFHYRTPAPVRDATIYFGPFRMLSQQADETLVEIYTQEKDLDELKNQRFTVNEIGNMLKFYNRRLTPLDFKVLRVASTPTSHGRGFGGMILLSESGFRGGSSSDTFRAHEVAHQWWGHIVDVRDWPEDRWLSESFAEFMALEYYKERFDKPEKLRDQIWQDWVQPNVEPFSWSQKNLAGEKIGTEKMERPPLCAGGGNVYSKGPAVLHMLRYVFMAQKESDEPFWAMLQDFLSTHRYQRAGTQDFINHAEKHLGSRIEWFWDQWVYGRQIPEVSWSHSIERSDAGWLLTVNAEQTTDYTLLLPVSAYFAGDRSMSRPLLLKGRTGSRRFVLPERPTRVTLNEFYESLARIKE